MAKKKAGKKFSVVDMRHITRTLRFIEDACELLRIALEQLDPKTKVKVPLKGMKKKRTGLKATVEIMAPGERVPTVPKVGPC